MKKLFILTGEPSGDKLASKVIIDLKKINQNIEFLSVGGEHLQSLGIKSIYDLNEITYLGFTNVILNILKINKKINETVKSIIDYNPDILFTVDSPDFTLRVAEKVKKINTKIRTVHYVAPQVWVWREGRVKKIKSFIDHILLLFHFEKKYFEKENVSCEFVGHPLLENKERSKIDINQIIGKNKALISVFAGSRKSEILVLMPILLDFIKLMNEKYTDMTYVFHSTREYSDLLKSFINKSSLSNCEIVSDDKIKAHILQKSVFAVAKSGTVSLEISNAKIPSIILYKMGFINFMIVKSLVKTKYANIINFAANEEIIPELLQSNCNSKNIYKHVSNFLDDPNKIKEQVNRVQSILDKLKINRSSSELASLSLNKFL
ncbi:lipid-A-disaccharide synthase [Pelagibacterales bacterium SAG-MED29]|nr:lipid-A-disaccharide synthase [Pelagibacterales bacterium SAG-MED29]